jgi:hypothetical protein
MLRMLDRHAVQELVSAEVPAGEIATQLKVSVRTVRRTARESAVAGGDDVTARAACGIGRPKLTPMVYERIVALVRKDLERRRARSGAGRGRKGRRLA